MPSADKSELADFAAAPRRSAGDPAAAAEVPGAKEAGGGAMPGGDDPGAVRLHPLLAALRHRGALSTEEAAEVISLARREHIPVDRAVVSSEFVPERRVLETLGEALGLAVRLQLEGAGFSERFVRGIPVDYARRHGIVGLEEDGEGLLLAAATALEPEIVDAVSVALGVPVSVVLAAEAEITQAITSAYQSYGSVGQTAKGAEADLHPAEESDVVRLLDAADTDQDLLATAESAPVVNLVNKLLFEALRDRASDVHIQPTAEGVVVRYRVDGVLHAVATYPVSVLEPVVSRIKVMARMDITERRLPQDGRTTVRLGNKNVDLRISTVPSNYGERVVMRLLDRSGGLYGLEELGLPVEYLAVMDRIVRSANGVFFCTGPTGSGKTTTLYAALRRIDSSKRNIITVEDPIEYHLPGITQLPVTERKGMSFASGLRSILRQDPDVIMVGEVRDVETAQMVVRAAQTGHLVLSTLHTNDSAGAVARLLDFGVEPFLLSSCLTAVLAQRLVRRTCPGCSQDYEPTRDELERLGLDPGSAPTFRRGRGCDQCLGTGYYGRVGVYELLVVDDAIRTLILQRAGVTTIRESALQRGLVTLYADGVKKVLAGITTVEEVLRVTQQGVAA